MSDMQNSPRSRIGIASTSISILMFLLGFTLGNVSVGRSLLKLDEQHISRNHAVQHNISDAEGTANKKIESRDQISTKAVVEKAPSIKGAVENIILIGERHSGTNWITDYLTECFQGDQIKVCETCKTSSSFICCVLLRHIIDHKLMYLCAVHFIIYR